MAYVTTNRSFVYGIFYIKAMGRPALRAVPENPFAIEILREFSASEFIGKLYQRVSNAWVPMPLNALNDYPWYGVYLRTKGRAKLVFYMEGSGEWDVQHFREESDET